MYIKYVIVVLYSLAHSAISASICGKTLNNSTFFAALNSSDEFDPICIVKLQGIISLPATVTIRSVKTDISLTITSDGNSTLVYALEPRNTTILIDIKGSVVLNGIEFALIDRPLAFGPDVISVSITNVAFRSVAQVAANLNSIYITNCTINDTDKSFGEFFALTLNGTGGSRAQLAIKSLTLFSPISKLLSVNGSSTSPYWVSIDGLFLRADCIGECISAVKPSVLIISRVTMFPTARIGTLLKITTGELCNTNGCTSLPFDWRISNVNSNAELGLLANVSSARLCSVNSTCKGDVIFALSVDEVVTLRPWSLLAVNIGNTVEGPQTLFSPKVQISLTNIKATTAQGRLLYLDMDSFVSNSRMGVLDINLTLQNVTLNGEGVVASGAVCNQIDECRVKVNVTFRNIQGQLPASASKLLLLSGPPCGWARSCYIHTRVAMQSVSLNVTSATSYMAKVARWGCGASLLCNTTTIIEMHDIDANCNTTVSAPIISLVDFGHHAEQTNASVLFTVEDFVLKGGWGPALDFSAMCINYTQFCNVAVSIEMNNVKYTEVSHGDSALISFDKICNSRAFIQCTPVLKTLLSSWQLTQSAQPVLSMDNLCAGEKKGECLPDINIAIKTYRSESAPTRGAIKLSKTCYVESCSQQVRLALNNASWTNAEPGYPDTGWEFLIKQLCTDGHDKPCSPHVSIEVSLGDVRVNTRALVRHEVVFLSVTDLCWLGPCRTQVDFTAAGTTNAIRSNAVLFLVKAESFCNNSKECKGGLNVEISDIAMANVTGSLLRTSVSNLCLLSGGKCGVNVTHTLRNINISDVEAQAGNVVFLDFMDACLLETGDQCEPVVRSYVYNASFTNCSSDIRGSAVMIKGPTCRRCISDVLVSDSFFGSCVAGEESGGALDLRATSALFTGTIFVGNKAALYGGAVMSSANVTLVNCSCRANSATTGGCVHSLGAIRLENTRMAMNHALHMGGAVRGSFVQFSTSDFNNNTSDYQGGALHGAVVIGASSNFTHNTASRGGALSASTSLNVFDTNFGSNTATVGGAVHSDGEGFITRCEFWSNSAANQGGAITASTLTANDSHFEGNHALRGKGGAVWARDQAYLTSLVFLYNKASEGGGVYTNFAEVRSVKFESNSAQFCGGMKLERGDVSQSIFTANQADSVGGGLCTSGNISNSVFTMNRAEDCGGGVYTLFPEQIESVEFSSNGAIRGAGLCIVTEDLTMYNTVLTNLTFRNNTAQSFGGAIYIKRNGNENTTIVSSNFRGHFATEGGTIYAVAPTARFGGVLIVGSNFENSDSYAEGGTISVEGTDLDIRNSQILSSSSFNGGAISARYGRLVILNTIVKDCSSDFGGGIYFVFRTRPQFSTSQREVVGEGLIMKDTTVTRCIASLGGGLYVTGGRRDINDNKVSITGTNFTNCTAYAGGGAYFEFSTVTTKESGFQQNKARRSVGIRNTADLTTFNDTSDLLDIPTNPASGGGVHAYNCSLDLGGTIEENSAEVGGGIAAVLVSWGRQSLMRLSSNSADFVGGGIAIKFSDNADKTRLFGHFISNKAAVGGGIFIFDRTDALFSDLNIVRFENTPNTATRYGPLRASFPTSFFAESPNRRIGAPISIGNASNSSNTIYPIQDLPLKPGIVKIDVSAMPGYPIEIILQLVDTFNQSVRLINPNKTSPWRLRVTDISGGNFQQSHAGGFGELNGTGGLAGELGHYLYRGKPQETLQIEVNSITRVLHLRVDISSCLPGYGYDGHKQLCDPCLATFYSVGWLNVCYPCTEGMRCRNLIQSYDSNSGRPIQSVIGSFPGWWLSSPSSGGRVLAFRCPLKEMCTDDNTCASNHDSRSIACSGCIGSYSSYGGECIDCKPLWHKFLFAIGSIFAGGVIRSIVIVWASIPSEYAGPTLVIQYTQVILAVIETPHFDNMRAKLASAVSLSTSSLWMSVCVADSAPELEFYLKATTPAMYIFFIGLVVLAWRRYQRRNPDSPAHHNHTYRNSLMLLLFMASFEAMDACVKAIDCTIVMENYYVVSTRPAIQCYTSSHKKFLMILFTIAGIYIVMIIGAFTYVFISLSRDRNQTLAAWPIMFASFEHRFLPRPVGPFVDWKHQWAEYWLWVRDRFCICWGMVLVLRKMLFLTASTGQGSDPVSPSCRLLVIVISFLCLHFIIHPFTHPSEDIADGLSFIAIAFALIMQLFATRIPRYSYVSLVFLSVGWIVLIASAVWARMKHATIPPPQKYEPQVDETEFIDDETRAKTPPENEAEEDEESSGDEQDPTLMHVESILPRAPAPPPKDDAHGGNEEETVTNVMNILWPRWRNIGSATVKAMISQGGPREAAELDEGGATKPSSGGSPGERVNGGIERPPSPQVPPGDGSALTEHESGEAIHKKTDSPKRVAFSDDATDVESIEMPESVDDLVDVPRSNVYEYDDDSTDPLFRSDSLEEWGTAESVYGIYSNED